MSRDFFTRIRSHIVFRPEQDVPDLVKVADPLWFSWPLINFFQKWISQVAIPLGTSALDKNTAATKARCAAVCYLPNKPEPYGIHFYAVVGTTPGAYLHSINNN